MELQKQQQKTLEIQLMINKALLVEDDSLCRKIHVLYLSQLGYQVEIAKNAREAIRLINKGIYTLTLIDLGLPDQPGETVIQAVNRSKCNQLTPIIVCTSHADQAKKQKCRTLGAREILMKPILKATLQEAIKKINSIGNNNVRF